MITKKMNSFQMSHDHDEGEQEYDQFDEMDDFATIDFNGNSSEKPQTKWPSAVAGGGKPPDTKPVAAVAKHYWQQHR